MSTEVFTQAAKVQGIINRIRTQEAVFQGGHWSSAENFERELRKDGFVPPIPISHKYKFPDNLPEKECENMAMWLNYIIFFNPMRIYDTKKYVDMMTNGTSMTDAEKQAWYDKQMQVTGEMTDSDKEHIVMFFEKAQKHALSDFAKLARNLKKLNPEIADIEIDENSVGDLFDLVIGMTSRFHPDDIKYYMSTNDTEYARTVRHKLTELLGYEPNVFIDPNRINKIINGIIAQRNLQMGRHQ